MSEIVTARECQYGIDPGLGWSRSSRTMYKYVDDRLRQDNHQVGQKDSRAERADLNEQEPSRSCVSQVPCPVLIAGSGSIAPVCFVDGVFIPKPRLPFQAAERYQEPHVRRPNMPRRVCVCVWANQSSGNIGQGRLWSFGLGGPDLPPTAC